MHSLNLFGEPDQIGRRRPPKHIDVFDAGGDLSHGERQVIAGFLHSHAKTVRSAGYHNDKTALKLDEEADRYQNCGLQGVGLQCPDCRTRYFIKIACRSRICERCGRIYRNELRRQITPLLSQTAAHRRRGYTLALLTLTVTSNRFRGELPDRQDIVRLYRETSAFFRLFYGNYEGRYSRSGKIVENRKKPQGAGWIATLEIGKDNNNAHCHAIIYGPYIPWEILQKAWEKITQDSRGVDIRPVTDLSKVADYVLKYITKPPDTESYGRIADYAVMIKGTRRIRSGGIFYNRLKRIKREKQPCDCLFCNARLLYEGIIESLADAGERIDYHQERRQIDRDATRTAL